MYGPHSRLLLLTIALLLEETFRILLPYSQADPRKDLGHGSCAPYDVERRKRPLWLSGALASPILEAQKWSDSSQNAQRNIMEDILLDNNPAISADSTSKPVVSQEETVPTTGQDDESEDDLVPPSRMNVPMGWVDPRLRGGQMLDFVLPGRGEPLNVIISGLSDPYILTPRGLLHYAQTFGFSSECLGLHIGYLHIANLGDSVSWKGPRRPATLAEDDEDNDPFPNSGGNRTEQLLARQNFDWPLYGWPDYGTCWESLVGGNHFRAWKQDGAGARTGAWFLAASKELWVGAHHDIASDGYNAGRDELVMRALRPTRWSPTNEGIWWRTEVAWNSSLLEPGKTGINHGISQDGRVAILTVRRREGPPTLEELEAYWGQVVTTFGQSNGTVQDFDVRRARWELQQTGEDDVRIRRQQSWYWTWVLQIIYRSFSLF